MVVKILVQRETMPAKIRIEIPLPDAPSSISPHPATGMSKEPAVNARITTMAENTCAKHLRAAAIKRGRPGRAAGNNIQCLAPALMPAPV